MTDLPFRRPTFVYLSSIYKAGYKAGYRAGALGVILGATLASLLSGCGGKTPIATSTGSPGSTGSSPGSTTATGSLTLTPQNPTVSPGASVTFSTSGGVSPYTYYVTSGSGTFNGAVYTAPSTPEIDQVTVTDSSGLMAVTTVTVSTSSGTSSSALQVNPVAYLLNLTIAPGASLTFTTSGGTAPYSYSVVSGNGSFNGDVYTAPATSETDEIQVKDSSGLSTTSSVIVSTTANGIVPVYRFYLASTGEHFYSLSPTEGITAGFSLEGLSFDVFSSDTDPGAMALLYRCFETSLPDGMHFISDLPGCEGYTTEGTYGYVYTSQASATAPLYRFYNATSGDHLESTNSSSALSAGYSLEGVLGYVPIF